MKKSSKKKLKIVSIIPRKHKETWQKLANEWDEFFNIEHIIDDFSNFDNYLNMHIDFLFIEVNYFEKTLLSTIENFKFINKSFSIVIIKDFFSHRDAELLKNLADDVINFEYGIRYLKWKTLSLLRRYWHTFSKPTTIFHRELIIDLNNFYISKNRKIIRLTHKEWRVFKELVSNINKFISKQNIFEKIWETKDLDNTRSLDQILFKIKNKIGYEYFENNKNNFIRFK